MSIIVFEPLMAPFYLQVKLSVHLLRSLAMRLLHIDATQDPPRQPSELSKVILPFAIQEPEALGGAPGAIIKQHDGARGKLATTGTPFFYTIAQVRVEQHEAVPISRREFMQVGKRLG
jgi:hypothetical protein